MNDRVNIGMKVEYGGVLQFFYHCPDELLPIRDIRYKGKTEPHYENLTENWCSECMNRRIRAVNSRQLDYLFLFTRYRYKTHKYHDKYLIVGYLKRAQPERFLGLNKRLKSDVNPFEPENPESCGFFAGDPKRSKFVSADDSYLLTDIKNARQFPWLLEPYVTKIILKHFEDRKNILAELQVLAKKLIKEKKLNESCSNSCRN